MAVVNNDSSLSDQPVNKLFWRYTFPAVAGMLVNGLYSTIDGVFIGQVVGAEGLAAISLSWPIFGTVIGIGLMVGMGAASQSSIFRGEGNTEKAKEVVGDALILLLLSSILISIIIFTSHSALLSLMNAEGVLYEMAASYLHYTSLGSLAAMAGAALPMIVRNDERPELATAMIVTGAVLNIILDYILIVLLGKGVAGAAIATIMAQAVTTLWSFLYFFSAKARLRLCWQKLELNVRHYRRILSTGLPSLTMFMYFGFVLAVHNRLFLEYGSTLSLAAFTIVGYVQAFYYMVAEGIANGIQPIVSFNKGAGNNRNIHAVVKMGVTSVLWLGIATVAFINLWPEAIALIFNSENSALIEETTRGLKLHLFTMYLDGFIVVAAAYFQALGRYKSGHMGYGR